MKRNKIIPLVVTLLAALILSSCGNETERDEVFVTCTNFAMYDFASHVFGDCAEVVMLLPLESEQHDFEATLGDIDKIASSDLFVCTGGESEDWVDDVFASLGDMKTGIKTVCAADCVETYEEETVEGMRDDGDESGIDEHVWTSIPNAVRIIRAIESEAVLLCPEDEETIHSNVDSYIAELNEIDLETEETVKNAVRNVIIVADRFPFRYFAERYELDYYAAFSGCTSNTEPTLSTVNFLIEKVREEDIPAVLVMEFSDRKCAEAVSVECGCDIMELHSAHNVTKEDYNAGVTYADLMRRNLEVLKTVLY